MITIRTKTASVRLPKEMFEEIDEICDGIDCSRNDWIKHTLQEKLREENNETEDQKPKKEQKPQKITITPIGDDEPFRPSKGVQIIQI